MSSKFPKPQSPENAVEQPPTARPEPWHPIHDIPQNSVVRAIADYIYAQAPRQNRTFASVAAIALWAGIVGRNVNVMNAGLNLYFLVIAGTGRGKDGMVSGITKLVEAIAKTMPNARNLVSGKFASAQAILQHLKANPGTLSIQGEGEYLFRRLTSPKASQNDQELLQTLLELFSKSGLGQVFTGYRKADLAASVAQIYSPTFTLLTEGTFGLIDALLDNESIRRGLGPRCSVVISEAARPDLNPDAKNATPDQKLVEYLAGVVSWASSYSSPLQVVNTTFSEEANEIQTAFDRETTSYINNSGNNVEAELWNRSHLKAVKTAALIAAGFNPYCPQIDATTMQWAIAVERFNVNQLLSTMESGEVGEVTEDVRLSRIIKACAEYVNQREPWLFPKGYRVDAELHDCKIISNRPIGTALQSVLACRLT